MQPDVLLIDEALGVGDIEFREKSNRAMQEKIKSEQTVVLVSHDESTIRSLCNRAVWIEEGISRMEGDVESVVDAYEEFVKSHPRVN
jgi:lipopolysaccharide transport system ATP-binding protein